MSERWTPGPWRVQFNGVCWQIDANADAIATTQFCYASESEANARLIAAAPDLYEALMGVVRVADRKTVEFDAARAALAKARGEMP